jgi:spore germination protein
MNPTNPTDINNPLPEGSVLPAFSDPDADSKKEMHLMERLLEVNLGVSVVLGVAVLLLTAFVFAWKFNVVDFFKQSPKTEAKKTSSTQPKLADSGPRSLFINEQTIELKKIFTGNIPKVKITVNGQLKREVFGFLPYWMLDRVDEINTQLLTSISYFGLEVDGNGEIVKTDIDAKNVEAWSRWQNDKKLDSFLKSMRRNRIKTYVTLKAFNNDNIEKLVLSEQSSQKFISNALYLMNSRSLDGINIDFEYVGTPDQKVIDGYSVLMSRLNKELKRQYPKSVLTISTYISAASTTKLHDVQILAKNCDGLVIMGYDFHTPGSASAGPIAPMEGYGDSLMGMMGSYLEKVPPEKLILALGYYGYDWPVIDRNKNGQVNAASDVQVLSYSEIADVSKKMKIEWDDKAQTPWYSYTDDKTSTPRIVHFENARSLGIKYDFINQKNLQGVGIWALGFDGHTTELQQLLADKFAN